MLRSLEYFSGKQFINVMEELVLSEAIARVAEIEAASDINSGVRFV